MIENIILSIVTNDSDWEVLYLNNEILSEGHTIDVFDSLSSSINNIDVNIIFNKYVGDELIFEEEDYTHLGNILYCLDRVY